MPDHELSGILFRYMLRPRDSLKGLKPATARIIAVVFLLIGILLGALDAPHYLSMVFSKFNIPTAGIFEKISGSIPYRFGLDLQGGTHLVYRADMKNIPEAERQDAMEAVRNVIERRVNLFGVTEPVGQVERSGPDWRLVVELAGVKDIGQAVQLIGLTPFLEFREERSQEESNKILEEQKAGTGPPSEDPYFKPTALTGRFVKKAEVLFGQSVGQPLVGLELNDEGAKLFEELTEKNVGKRLAIYLDNAPISIPVVNEKISGGRAQITGNFTPVEAKELAERLNAGALPVPIELIVQQSVGASLGQDSLARSLRAGVFGFLVVAIFMIFWYRLPGLLAVLALLLYTALLLFLFKLIPGTLTVAGIAGFILSIGMAVDANILIFERMREELRGGKVLTEAIQEGFGRAWTSIRDSNVSSLITCAILYWLGSSIVKGFALTLALGILVSMLSAISITRTLLFAVVGPGAHKIKFLFTSGFSK